jgi:hypothetical protein
VPEGNPRTVRFCEPARACWEAKASWADEAPVAEYDTRVPSRFLLLTLAARERQEETARGHVEGRREQPPGGRSAAERGMLKACLRHGAR